MSDVAPARAVIGIFERYLTLWVAGCIVLGTALGRWLPDTFAAIGAMEVAKVNLPIALLIWLMIVPMLLKIDLGAMRQVGRHWKGMGVTLFINWVVKPFSMALFAWLFLRHVFPRYLPIDQIDSYVAGLILLAAAPCTAMVFVWSNLCRRHHGGGVCSFGHALARHVRHHGAVGNTGVVGRSLHCRTGDRYGALASNDPVAGWGRSIVTLAASLGSRVVDVVVDHLDLVVWLSG
jgi:hypothetical protein